VLPATSPYPSGETDTILKICFYLTLPKTSWTKKQKTKRIKFELRIYSETSWTKKQKTKRIKFELRIYSAMQVRDARPCTLRRRRWTRCCDGCCSTRWWRCSAHHQSSVEHCEVVHCSRPEHRPTPARGDARRNVHLWHFKTFTGNFLNISKATFEIFIKILKSTLYFAFSFKYAHVTEIDALLCVALKCET